MDAITGRCARPDAPAAAVDLWFVETDGFDPDRRFTLLDEAERERAGRFRRAGDRRDFVAAHALARLALAAAGAGAPADLAFPADARGKPRLPPRPGGPDLRFSLTHTAGLVAVVVAAGMEVGVDAESLDRARLDAELAEAVFTPAEIAVLPAPDAPDWRRAFLRLWTLKEAVLKAWGTGLATPLKAFRVQPDPPRLTVLEPSPERDAGVRLHVPDGAPRHLLAVAAASDGRPLVVRAHAGWPV